MGNEYEQSHASPTGVATAHNDTVEPGQSSRSALLRKPDHAVASGLVQRKARDSNRVADGADHAVAAAASSSGSPLLDTLMLKFASSLGTDLSGVRVHTGGASERAANAVGAEAYTMGNDIYFGAGHYDPSNSGGQPLIAHEAAHTVQQSGRAQGMQLKLEAPTPGEDLEHKADRAAAKPGASTLAERSSPSAEANEVPHRAQMLLSANAPTIESMEHLTGYDLSHVRVYERSRVADASGMQGLTIGAEVHLSSSLACEGSGHFDHVLRHELAHVVQQGTGAAGVSAHLEHEAERAARASVGSHGTGASRKLAFPARPMAQAYDPRFHRRNTVAGLVGTGFSDQQIGQIYAANWERDLSQAHPMLGNTILCWKAVKVAAYRHDAAAFAAASADLRRTMASLLDVVLGGSILNIAGGVIDIAGGKSYGGYRFYHHFDNPTPASLTKHPDKPDGLTPATASELRGRSAGLPQHLVDSREYVKAQLVEATRQFRGDFDGAPAMHGWDTFLARERMLCEKITAGGSYAWSKPVNDSEDPSGTLTSPITAETSIQAANERQKYGLAEGSSVDQKRFTPLVADALGRAGHALEDFFSHSNFVELALGEPTPGMEGLDTGTFESNDSMHALSHKLRGLIDDVNNNTLLLNAALSDGKLPEGALRMDLASEELPHPSVPYATGGIWYGVVGVARGIGRLKSGKSLTFQQAQSASGQLLTRLGSVSDQLEQSTRNKAASGSHTMIAKDQPGHAPGDPRSEHKSQRFWTAQALSEQANRLVIGRMPAVLSAGSMAEANSRLEAILATLDLLIAAPSPEHPCWPSVETAVKSVQKK